MTNILEAHFPVGDVRNWDKNKFRTTGEEFRPQTFNEWVEQMQPAYDAIKGTNVQDKLIDQELGL